MLFGTTMLMVSISLVMAVIVTNIYLRKDSGNRVPLCVRKTLLHRAGVTSQRRRRQASLASRVSATENHILESKLHAPLHVGASRRHFDADHDATLHPHDAIEIDQLSNHSEIETLTGTRRCNSVTRGLGVSRTRSTSASFRPPDVDVQEKASAEWQALAKVVDRLCFWIFLLSSIAALTSMFAQIPAYNAT